MTSHYPDRCFAFDQFGPLSIRPCHGTCWAKRKHPARLRATYHRTHGNRLERGQGVISALVLAGHAPQLVIAQGIAAVEVAEPTPG